MIKLAFMQNAKIVFTQPVANITTPNTGQSPGCLVPWKSWLANISFYMYFTGIAQLVEHRSPKPGVGGSSPSARAILFSSAVSWQLFLFFG